MPYDLNPYEARALIDFFMYRLSGEERKRLMHEFPKIYNKICEREIMVSKVRDEIVEENKIDLKIHITTE